MKGHIELQPQNNTPRSQSLQPPPYTNSNLRNYLRSMPIPSSPPPAYTSSNTVSNRLQIEPPRYTNNNRQRYIQSIRNDFENAYDSNAYVCNDNESLQDINRFFPRVPTHAHQELSITNHLPSLEEIQRRLHQLQRNIRTQNNLRPLSGGYGKGRKINKSRKVGRGKNRQQKKEKEKQKKSTAKNTFTGKHIRHKQHLMELASKRSNSSKKSNKKKQRK